jgi:hypothetical protein
MVMDDDLIDAETSTTEWGDEDRRWQSSNQTRTTLMSLRRVTVPYRAVPAKPAPQATWTRRRRRVAQAGP